MKQIALVITLALSLAGCQSAGNVGSFFSDVVSAATSPLGTVDIYRVKNVYAAADQLAIDYRSYCYARPYAVLMSDSVAQPVCKYRRQVIRTFQAKRIVASRAIANATTSSLLTVAWTAVSDYKNAVPVVK